MIDRRKEEADPGIRERDMRPTQQRKKEMYLGRYVKIVATVERKAGGLAPLNPVAGVAARVDWQPQLFIDAFLTRSVWPITGLYHVAATRLYRALATPPPIQSNPAQHPPAQPVLVSRALNIP